MSPEESQKLVDLRVRILENEQRGLPPHEGIPKEELAAAIALIRGKAAAGASVGGAKTAAARKQKAQAKTSDASQSLADKLKAMGLDLN